MKKILLLMTALTLGASAFSQDEDMQIKNDTTTIDFGDSKILFIGKSCQEKKDTVKKEGVDAALSIDFGTNGYFSSEGNLNLPAGQELMEIDYARSRAIGFSIVMTGADIIKDRLYIQPGLGITWNNYFFENNINISTANDSTSFTTDSIISYNKYKLRSTYLQVPLVLGLRMGNLDMPVGLQVGVIGSFRLGSMVKEKYEFQGSKYKAKIKDDFNLSPFKFDAVARISIGDVGFFARYSLTTLFEKNKAPEVYPFSAGITIGGFMN